MNPMTPRRTTSADSTGETMPTFSEQVSDQLGGVRGMVESSVPVLAFVIVTTAWDLRPALIISVVTALAIAAYRRYRRQSVRHALNGLFGIGIGALIAWRTGNPKDFFAPGIVFSLGYGLAMIGSVVVRRPLVGWIWSVIADRGRTRWYDDMRLRRTFGWLTVLWAATYLAKAGVTAWVYFADGLSRRSRRRTSSAS